MMSFDLEHLESDELLFELNLRGIDRGDTNAREMLRNRMLIENEGDIPWTDTMRVIRSVTSEVSVLTDKLLTLTQDLLEANENENFERVNELMSRLHHVFNRIDRLNVGKGEMQGVKDLVQEMQKARKQVKLVQHSLGASGLDASGGSSAPNATPSSVISRNCVVESRVLNDRQKRPSSLSIVNTTAATLPITEAPLEPGQQQFLSTLFNRNSMPFSGTQQPQQSQPQVQSRPNQLIHQYAPNPPIQQRVPSQLIQQDDHFQPMPQQAVPRALGQPMTKWRIRFGGADGDLAIDEFLFRIENLALADGIPQASLVLGLHFLLVGSAANFYWVYRRKRPQGSWQEYRRAFLDQFSTQETDLEIRKTISDRKQNQREEFGEFALEVERLVARMHFPMEDDEVMEILKCNMLPYLQNAVWLLPPTNLSMFKQQCRRMEKLRRTQEDVAKDRRARVAEICSIPPDPQYLRIRAGQSVLEDPNYQFHREESWGEENVAAIHPNRQNDIQGNKNYIICWNCDDMGHTYADCNAADQRIFCFGCGTKNVIKPQCQRCNQSGNGRPNVVRPGQLRSLSHNPSPNYSMNNPAVFQPPAASK